MGTKAIWKGQNLTFFDPQINSTYPAGLWTNCPLLTIRNDMSIGVVHEDDFRDLDVTSATGKYVALVADGGTAAPSAVANGVAVVTTHTDANDEAYVKDVTASFTLATGKPLWFECRAKWTNSATTLGDFIVGLMTVGGAANTLLDTQGGPVATYDGFCFFKLAATAVVQFETSVATAQVTNATFGTFTSAAWMIFGAYFDGVSKVTPYLDGVAGTAHTIALTGSPAAFCFGAKGGTAAEICSVDYMRIVQLR